MYVKITAVYDTSIYVTSIYNSLYKLLQFSYLRYIGGLGHINKYVYLFLYTIHQIFESSLISTIVITHLRYFTKSIVIFIISISLKIFI